MDKFIGYHSSLPIKQGQTITIKKGMPVRTLKHGVTGAGRTYKVKVNHILNGQTLTVGTVLRRQGEDEKFVWMCSDRDLYFLMGRFGLSTAARDFEASKATLQEMALKNLVPVKGAPDGRAFTAVLHTCNPSIRWAGTGGYWCEIDINAFLEIN